MKNVNAKNKKADTRNTYKCKITGELCKARTLSKAKKILRSGSVIKVARWNIMGYVVPGWEGGVVPDSTISDHSLAVRRLRNLTKRVNPFRYKAPGKKIDPEEKELNKSFRKAVFAVTVEKIKKTKKRNHALEVGRVNG